MVEASCDFNNSYMSFNPSDVAVNNQALGAGDLSCGSQASVQVGGGKRRSRRTRRSRKTRRSRRSRISRRTRKTRRSRRTRRTRRNRKVRK